MQVPFLCFCADIDKSGFVSDYELQELFREASVYLPGYKVRDIIETFISGDTNKDQKISFEEFVYVSVDSVKIRAHVQTDVVRTDSACLWSDLPEAEEPGAQRQLQESPQ